MYDALWPRLGSECRPQKLPSPEAASVYARGRDTQCRPQFGAQNRFHTKLAQLAQLATGWKDHLVTQRQTILFFSFSHLLLGWRSRNSKVGLCKHSQWMKTLWKQCFLMISKASPSESQVLAILCQATENSLLQSPFPGSGGRNSLCPRVLLDFLEANLREQQQAWQSGELALFWHCWQCFEQAGGWC